MAGRVVGDHVAVLLLGRAPEHLACPLGKRAAFVDAEVVRGQLERELRCVRDRRGVAGAVPSRAHAEELRQRRHLARRREAADLRDVNADEVDQPLGDQRQVLVDGVEQLAHRDRHARLLAQLPEPAVVLGRERVLEEEEVVGLERLAEVDRFVELHALVDIVQQLHLVAQVGAQVREQLRQHPHVTGGFPDRTRVRRADGLVCGSARWRLTARAVRGQPRDAPLHAHVAEPGGHALARVVGDLGEVASAGVVVAVGPVANLAAEHLVQRQPGALAEDVPQRDVDAAHRVEEHRPVAPVRADVHRLPDVLDLVDAPADQERPQVLIDRRLHHQGTLRERGASPAVQAGLVGDDLHDHEADAVGRGQDHLHVLDANRRQAPRRWRCDRHLRQHFVCGHHSPARQHRARRRDRPEQVTSVHALSSWAHAAWPSAGCQARAHRRALTQVGTPRRGVRHADRSPCDPATAPRARAGPTASCPDRGTAHSVRRPRRCRGPPGWCGTTPHRSAPCDRSPRPRRGTTSRRRPWG